MHLVQNQPPPANAQPPLHFRSRPRPSARPRPAGRNPPPRPPKTLPSPASPPHIPAAALRRRRPPRLPAAARTPPNREAAGAGFGPSGGPAATVGLRRVSGCRRPAPVGREPVHGRCTGRTTTAAPIPPPGCLICLRRPPSSSWPASNLFCYHRRRPEPSAAVKQQPIQPAAIFLHRAHKVFDEIPQGKKLTKLDDLTRDWIVCLTVVVCIVDGARDPHRFIICLFKTMLYCAKLCCICVAFHLLDLKNYVII